MVINATGRNYIKGKKKQLKVQTADFILSVCSLLKGHQETCFFVFCLFFFYLKWTGAVLKGKMGP